MLRCFSEAYKGVCNVVPAELDSRLERIAFTEPFFSRSVVLSSLWTGTTDITLTE